MSELPLLFETDIPTVVAGDFNAKNKMWGCHSNNTKGNSLKKVHLRYNLSVEAPSSPTHFPTTESHHPDILDIFLTKNITLNKEPWTLPELSSDHNPVYLEIPFIPEYCPPTKMTTDFLHLKYILETSSFKCSQIKSIEDIDTAVLNLTNEINNSVQLASSSSPSNPRKTEISNNVTDLIKKKNRIRKLWQTRRKPRYRSRLNNIQKELNSALKETNDSAFENYIAEAEAHPKINWKIIKSLRNRKTHLPPLKKDNITYSSDEEKAEIFADSLEEQCSPLPSAEKHAEFHEHVRKTVLDFIPSDSEFKHTSPQEIAKIIRALKNRKAPGADGIGNGVLKILPRKFIVAICNIVNAMLRLHYFPVAWKEATVILLPKAGKPLSSPSSYRPISLLSSLSKIAEQVIRSRIDDFVDQNNIIPEFQHGFRRRHGTAHQLLRVSEHIADSLNKGMHLTMLLLDVKQAFDRVWHDGLLFKLIELKFPHYLIGIIESFLSNRTLRVRVGKALSSPRAITAGVPQGSKVSPALFNIFSYDYPNPTKKKEFLMVAQYADDSALLYASKQISACTNQLNKFTPHVVDWYHIWRAAINETKSLALFFSRRRRPSSQLKVNNHLVPWSDSAKYLGVTFDKKLTWQKHITSVRNKAQGAYSALKPFFNNDKVTQRTKLRAFNAIVRSICTYAIPIWGSAQPNRINKLQGTYMRLLRSSLKIPWFIRNQQILSETGIISIPEAASKYANNLRLSISNHDNPSIRSLSRYCHKTSDRIRRPCLLDPLNPLSSFSCFAICASTLL